MGTTGDDSRMTFHLDANDEEEAALIKMALDNSSAKYLVVETTQDAQLMDIVEGQLEFDPDDTFQQKVVRFVIEPNKNPMAQGYEIAGVVNVMRDQLTDMSSDPDDLELQVQLEQSREVDPEMKARFEELKVKFAETFT